MFRVTLQETGLRFLLAASPQSSRIASGRSVLDVVPIETNEFRQAGMIEEADMALAKFEKPALTEFPQHSIDMNRSKAKGVSEVVLRERTVKTVAVNRANSLQTSRQFEQQMRRPLQGGTSSYIGEMLSYHRTIAHERLNNEREQVRRFHSGERQCLRGCHEQREIGLSHESFDSAASIGLRQNHIASESKIENLSLSPRKLVRNAAPAGLDDVYTIVAVALTEDYRVGWISLGSEPERLHQRGVVIVKSNV